MADSLVTREEVVRSIDVLRRELDAAVRRLDELIRQRVDASAHGLDDARSARELLESADDELVQARSLLD